MSYKFFRNFKEDSVPYALRGKESPRCVFLVEGVAEASFLERWLETEGQQPTDIAVVAYRGGNRLSTVLRRLSEDDNFGAIERFGFFLDAETHTAAAKCAEVANALVDVGLLSAGVRLNAGELIEEGGKKFTLFVSPNNRDEGWIEDLVALEIGKSRIGDCLVNFAECIRVATGSALHSKSLVSSYLGACKPGLAGTHRGFEADHLNVLDDAYTQIRETFGRIL